METKILVTFDSKELADIVNTKAREAVKDAGAGCSSQVQFVDYDNQPLKDVFAVVSFTGKLREKK